MKKFSALSILLIAGSPVFAQGAPAESAAAENAPSSVSLFVENDFKFSDRYYTNGIKLTYADYGDDWWASAAQFAVLRAVGLDSDQAWQTASIGQNMCVGYDITDPNPPLDDRPYAGWLYLSSGAHLVKKDSLDSLTVTLGIVGPQSYAGDVQRAFHDIIDDPDPQGWRNQIKNEPGIVIAYCHAERLFEYAFSENFKSDFIGAAGANLGNVITEGRIKALFRIGFNLPNSFSEKRIDYSSSADVYYFDPAAADWHLYLYAGATARFVGYDITLNGNTFADSRSVDPKWLVGEGNLGVSAKYKNLELSLNWTIRSEEFNTQRGGPHFFWCANARVLF
ncbi:MAG: lipid A deacylase LpxR family protein [Opitutales bacterium]|nr:lipid A deacylase LpxR family protein [Opitutales bacterium]